MQWKGCGGRRFPASSNLFVWYFRFILRLSYLPQLSTYETISFIFQERGIDGTRFKAKCYIAQSACVCVCVYVSAGKREHGKAYRLVMVKGTEFRHPKARTARRGLRELSLIPPLLLLQCCLCSGI